ncbi:MAG: CPBP family intramembrane metalloprotease [Phycisphaerae bacterium]|nr:CPBP family intramembrane metalloprotease [Phycisphaerae bacterium]
MTMTTETLWWIDLGLIAFGAVVWIAMFRRHPRRTDWLRDLAVPHTRFTALDVLTLYVASWLLGGLIQLALAGYFIPSGPAGPGGGRSAASSSSPEPVVDTPGAGAPVAATQHAMRDPRTLAIGNVVGQLLTIGAVLFVAAHRVSGGLPGWGLARVRGGIVGPAVLTYLAALPTCVLLLWMTRGIAQWLNPEVAFDEHQTIELLRILGAEPAWVAVLLVVAAAVTGPVMEELLFRGALLNLIAQAGGSVAGAITASAVLFGLVHHRNPDTIPPLIAFGLVLGWVYARTRSLWTVIAAHALFNAKTLLWLLLTR